MSLPHKIHTFTSDHKEILTKIQNWYKDHEPWPNSIKVGWLNGMMKKPHYDEHERRMLNKMVTKYNLRLK